jgi:ribosomal-protein-alanine N-acetyltransferase
MTTLRTLSPADAAVMESMEQELFGSDAWSRTIIDDELAHPFSYYRGIDDGDLVAYAGLRAAPVDAGQGDIQTIAVRQSHQGRGLGRALLVDLMDEAQRRGVRELFLEVRADNEPAIALYQSLGFREIDRRAGYYQPDGVDAIVMCRVAHGYDEGGA